MAFTTSLLPEKDFSVTQPALPPLGTLFADVPDAAAVDGVELDRLNSQALAAGLAFDTLALDVVAQRAQAIRARHAGHLGVQGKAAKVLNTVAFQRRKLARLNRGGEG